MRGIELQPVRQFQEPILRQPIFLGQSVLEEPLIGISRRKVGKIAERAAEGALIKGGANYLEQRSKIGKRIPVKERTVEGLIKREKEIFDEVDKGKVLREAGKGAIEGGLIVIFDRESMRPAQPSVLRPAA
ncbi:hypothetical protein HYW41_03750 [Candidatus Daviesbacteria bacterium]|nr:hypothetical protein [Candidatus Daviesbacteria bacterium]